MKYFLSFLLAGSLFADPLLYAPGAVEAQMPPQVVAPVQSLGHGIPGVQGVQGHGFGGMYGPGLAPGIYQSSYNTGGGQFSPWGSHQWNSSGNSGFVVPPPIIPMPIYMPGCGYPYPPLPPRPPCLPYPRPCGGHHGGYGGYGCGFNYGANFRF